MTGSGLLMSGVERGPHLAARSEHPHPGGLDRHGNPNVLTRDAGTSRLGQGPSAQSALVEVTRHRGDAEPVRAHEPPSILRG